jgi:hypothetical protein
MPMLHNSDLSMLGGCPQMYELRKVEGIIIPPSCAMVAGTGTHKSAATNLTHKRDEGEPISLDDAKDAARDATTEEIETGGVYLVGDEQKEEKKLTAGAVDAAVTMAAAHHTSIAPTIAPKRIEEAFVVDIKGKDLQLAGTIDVQETNGAIRDLKTTAKSPSANVADRSVQLTMYHLGASYCFDEPAQMQLDYVVNLKSGPKIMALPTTRTKDDWRGLLLRVDTCHNQIKSGIFPPTTPDNWRCSEKYCGYYNDICPYGRRKRVTA